MAVLNINPFLNEVDLHPRGAWRFAVACLLAALFFVGGCESTPNGHERKAQPVRISRNHKIEKAPGRSSVTDSATELKKAKKLILAKAWKQAEDRLVRLVRSGGGNAEVFFWLGFVVYAQGRDKSAIECFSRAIILEPDFAEAYNNRGIARMRRGERDRAVADFTEAIRIKPDYAAPRVSRGQAWYGKGDSEKAIEDYTEAIRIAPESIDAYYHRGIARTALGEMKEAIADFEKCLTLRPADEARESIQRRIKELETWID